MDLTFEEKTYRDEFARAYARYGENIPDEEWLRLGEVREGLGVDYQKSRKIVEAVKFDSYKKSYLSKHPEMRLDKAIVKVTEKNICILHGDLKERRNKEIADFQQKKVKLEESLKEQETLETPKKVEDPGELNFVKIIISYAIGAGIIWYLDWLWIGIAFVVIETFIVKAHYSNIVVFEKFKEAQQNYLDTKVRLKHNIPALKVAISQLEAIITENLYSEINGGCAIPLPKGAVNENSWKDLSAKLDDIVASYTLLENVTDEALKREKAKLFFNKKLEFFYDVSIRSEAGTDVFLQFDKQLQNAISKNDIDLLRIDADEKSLLETRSYGYLEKLDGYKSDVEKMDISQLMSRYSDVKDMETSGFLGFASLDKLAAKTENLQRLYGPIKKEYDRLRKVSDVVNYYLTFARTVAYRNIYLGVELLNYIRDNAGGKSLMTQKDKVATSDAMDIAHVAKDSLKMSSAENVANTLNGLLSDTLGDKQVRKFVMKNPKMAAGAAALAVVGNLIDERVEKIKNNNELQEQLITSIGEMMDGYNSGKAVLLRAIEVIKALSKANIGFLAIYAPLRNKFFLDGCTKATMLDLQNLAKATQEYKHISDTKL